jgi:diguanylate cyclase (GGDEF)-like protein
MELIERSDDPEIPGRKMFLFPISIGGRIPAALAILDPIESVDIRMQIWRMCNSVAEQLEILRLRREVFRHSNKSNAVREFTERVKHIGAEDFWVRITQVAAELMQAERGSILIVDQETGELKIKAAIGARGDLSTETSPGGRVSKIVLERGEPILVSDADRSGLPEPPPERQYKTSSFLSSPVMLGDQNIAVINFTDKAGGGTFETSDLELFLEISPQIAVAIDRALLKESAGQYKQLSLTDSLTGLLNRRYIEERLVEEVKRSNRHGFPMSYIMVDVDHFKSYNDKFGHPAGDEALKIVANVFRDTLRGADVAARVGGEEFAILLPQTTNSEAAMIAERLRANVESAAFPHRKVTVSIGVASCSSELCTTTGMINAADKACYAAKNSGRNIVKIHADLVADDTQPT